MIPASSIMRITDRRAAAIFLAGLGVASVGFLAISAVTLESRSDVQPGPTVPSRHPRDPLREVAQRAPAFGGMFLRSSDGQLIVYILDDSLSTRAATQEAIASEYGSFYSSRHVVYVRGQYSYLELAEWYDTLLPAMHGMVEEVTVTDIDETRNRLVVGIEDTRSWGKVEEEIRKLNIPTKAVIIEEHPRVRLDLHR